MKQKKAPPPQPDIFGFQDYKLFLRRWLASRPNGGHGEKAKFATRAQCHPVYISQVLTGSAHFSLEQAEALATHLELSEEEEDFFLLLVQRARAGTFTLITRLDRKIQKALELRKALQGRFHQKFALAPHEQAVYFSHWSYSAVHAAVAIPSLRAPQILAEYFALPLEQAMEALRFLESVGAVERRDGAYQQGPTPAPAPLNRHHENWRLQTLRTLEAREQKGLHESELLAVAEKDLPKVRAVLSKALDEARKLARNSKPEKLLALSMDFWTPGSER